MMNRVLVAFNEILLGQGSEPFITRGDLSVTSAQLEDGWSAP
jgi:hypothetical protein